MLSVYYELLLLEAAEAIVIAIIAEPPKYLEQNEI